MQVLLNQEELSKLCGQIPELWQFYVVLKKFMDYRNGIVGIARGISWQSLQEEMYIEPGQGLTGTGTPAKSKIRRLAERAMKAGLIEDRSESKKLIFFLALAVTDQSAKNKPGTNPAQTRHTKPGTKNLFLCNEIDADLDNPGIDTNSVYPHFSEKPGTPPNTDIRKEERIAKAIVEFAAGEPDAPATPKPVQIVFDYWRDTMNHPRAKLDHKRRRVIAARLKDGYSVDTIRLAIDGCKSSPWHQGKNKDGRVFDDIELICRDAIKLEQFLKHTQKQHDQTNELDAWINDQEQSNCIEGEFRHVG